MFPNQNGTPKWVITLGVIASIATIIAAIVAYLTYVHPASGSSPGTTGNNNPGGVGTTTSAPVSAALTPNPIWNVILNRTYNTLSYKGYTVNDTQGHHFLIVDASFSNMSSVSQSLVNVFDLQDENGQHYPEDQASTPGRPFAVDPGQSIEIETAFVVPNSSCKFELSFIAASSVVSQWTISSSLCS